MMPVFGHYASAGRGDAGGDVVSAPPGVLLEARDVRKAYGRHEVLRGVDLAAGLVEQEHVGVVHQGEGAFGHATLWGHLALGLAWAAAFTIAGLAIFRLRTRSRRHPA
jgi:hypothetical protein